jgi:hypothetical protein
LATPGPPASDCLDVDVGLGGGPIELRVPPTLGRGFDIVIEGVLALDGVPVLGVEAFDVAADSCLVGDLVGDYKPIRKILCEIVQRTRSMLDGRDVLPAGLGLAAFILIRFPDPGSGTELILRPRAGPPTLLGLVGFFRAAYPFRGFAAGGG